MNDLKKRIIYIDCCAFNILFDENVNITVEFPDADYELRTTKGVVKELEDIIINIHIKEFALALVNSDQIHVDSFFGFSNGQNKYRQFGGFGEGSFIGNSQNNFFKATVDELGSVMKSGMRKHQIDRDLLAHSLGYIVLTAENVLGSGYLKQLAESQYTKVINIIKWQKAIQSKYVTLRKYVESYIVKRV